MTEKEGYPPKNFRFWKNSRFCVRKPLHRGEKGNKIEEKSRLLSVRSARLGRGVYKECRKRRSGETGGDLWYVMCGLWVCTG